MKLTLEEAMDTINDKLDEKFEGRYGSKHDVVLSKAGGVLLRSPDP